VVGCHVVGILLTAGVGSSVTACKLLTASAYINRLLAHHVSAST
jgi:hypothetical protein